MMKNQAPFPHVCGLVFCFFICSFTAQATTILELSFEELVAQSQLIFQGNVISTDVSEIDGLLYTNVHFASSELLKGEVENNEITLRFLGGNEGNAAVSVAGQYIPAVGDHGIYFVSTSNSNQINPLTGWHQGAFLIETAANGAASLNLAQRPDLVLLNTRADPLVRKMLDMKFTSEQIREKFPEALNFPLNDFKDAILALVEE